MITWKRKLRGAMQTYVPTMITCGQFEDALQQYLDGELPWWKRAKMRMHVSMCPECRAYLKAYTATVELGKEAFADSDAPLDTAVPDELVEIIMSGVEADKGS